VTRAVKAPTLGTNPFVPRNKSSVQPTETLSSRCADLVSSDLRLGLAKKVFEKESFGLMNFPFFRARRGAKSMVWRVLLPGLAFFSASHSAWAHPALLLDPNFNPHITRITARVNATVLQPDGKVVVGGDFTQIGGAERHCVARLNTDGTADATFNPGVQGGSVFFVVRQGDGKIIIAGSFLEVNGVDRKYIARLNEDGSLDSGFVPGAGPSSDVDGGLGLQSDGKIIIAGNFSSVNGVTRNDMARLNSDGTLDESFDLGTGVAGSSAAVYEIAVQTDDRIVVGGKFTSINGTNRGGIARLNSNGTLDDTFAPSGVTLGSATVSMLGIQGDGKILIGGSFSRVNGSSRTNLARLFSTGGLDGTFNPGVPDTRVFSLRLQTDGKVLVGGEFNSISGIPRISIARFSSLGALDATFDPGTALRHTTFSISVQTDGKIILGNFANATGQMALERLMTNGVQDATYNPGPILDNGFINATALQPDGKIVIGGDFDFVDSVARRRVARLNPDGTLDSTFDAGTGPSGSLQYPYTVAVQPDGKILLGGGFTSVNGTTLNRIARLNVDGTVDGSFTPGTGANSRVFSLTLQNDGKIIVGGGFTTFNSISKPNLVRLTANGLIDPNFTTGTGPNGTVYATTLQSDGKIILGGNFTLYNGTSRNCRARLNTNGLIDTNFVPAVTSPDVRSCVAQPDGKIVFGGYFLSANWTTVQRLNSNGTLDQTIGTGSQGNEIVYALGLLTDGSPVFGGGYLFENRPATRLGRLGSDGSIDEAFAPTNSTLGQILSIAASPDGSVICGGGFTQLYGVARTSLARLVDMRPRLIPGDNTEAGVFQLTLQGQIGYPYRVEVSSNLTSWATLTNFTSSGNTTLVRDSNSEEKKFYRAVLE
jgi:uncharacterized delta-60 repeat protein